MLILGLIACQHDITTVFPAGLEPLGEVTSDWPVGTDSDPYPEEVVIESGDDGVLFGTARGYVQADIETTFLAVQNADVVTDRRKVSTWTVTDDVEPDYEVSFLIHNVVEDIVTVEYDLTWREGHTDDESGSVACRWAKTDGSSLIEILEGSIVLTPVDDGVTGFEVVEHLKAPASGTDRIEAYLADLHASVVADVHGDPLPTY